MTQLFIRAAMQPNSRPPNVSVMRLRTIMIREVEITITKNIVSAAQVRYQLQLVVRM